jgi:hypothetical protein
MKQGVRRRGLLVRLTICNGANMREVKGPLFLLFLTLMGGLWACSLVSYGIDKMADNAKTADCKADEYIVPDAREFTSGGAYIDKYCSTVSGKCQCVKLTGKVTLLHLGILRLATETKPSTILELSVEGGLKTIPVYASSKFNQQLQTLKQDQLVAVEGRALALGNSLGVLLKKIETEPQ